jgi:hypothetical protein
MIRHLAACAVVLAAFALPARADLLVVIDKASQQIRVLQDGTLAHVFKTSTGMYGSGTPVGSYRVERLHRYWYSRKYDNAPMPHSIFFHDAYAIHGTTVISRLGNPASHGCVRLHPKDAAVLFALVQEVGKDDTTVIVTGANPPRPAPPAVSTRRQRNPARARSSDPDDDDARRLWDDPH